MVVATADTIEITYISFFLFLAFTTNLTLSFIIVDTQMLLLIRRVL